MILEPIITASWDFITYCGKNCWKKKLQLSCGKQLTNCARKYVVGFFFSFLQTVFMREIANFAEPLHLLLVRWKEYIESTKWKSLGEEKDYVVKKLDPRFFQIQILFIIIMINYIGIYSAQFKPEKNRTQKKSYESPH